jgi:hypothetical protein
MRGHLLLQFGLLAQLFQETGIFLRDLNRLLILRGILLMKLVLRNLQHLLQIFQALFQSLSPAWDPTSILILRRNLLHMTGARLRRNVLSAANIATKVVISHVELLGSCQINLLGLLIGWLLRRLPRLMMMVVMIGLLV